MNELPCFKCGKELEPVMPEDQTTNHPYAGTVFTSHGQYGSTVFDPIMGEEFLEVTLCDECLLAAPRRVLRGDGRAVARTYAPWEPGV